MKLRQARKIMFSRHWNEKLMALRPAYYEAGHWVLPSHHDIPIRTLQKASKRYFKAFNKFPKKKLL